MSRRNPLQAIVYQVCRASWRLLPETLKLGLTEHPRVVLLRQYLYDFNRYRRWAIPIHSKPTREHLRALITMRYHIVEKGLSLKEPRPGFGTENINSLFKGLSAYVGQFGVDDVVVSAVKSLKAYEKFHGSDQAVTERIRKQIGNLAKSVSPTTNGGDGGVIRKTRDQILCEGKLRLDNFFGSRHSIRHFGDAPATQEQIKHAIKLAITTPSVCNRQAWRVHVYTGKGAENVLLHQNGNRGFGDQASHVLLVTCDLRCFLGKGERNQAWIDGGMFAMSLVYALHSLGLGSCCLNMSNDMYADTSVRQAAGIPDNEVCIMMIAVGTLPESLSVARSQRYALTAIAQWHVAT